MFSAAVASDTITVSAGTISGNVDGGSEGDIIRVLGGTIGGTVIGGSGADTIDLRGGSIGNVDGGDDADTITLNGSVITNLLSGGDGADTITVLAGSVNAVMADGGNDKVEWRGGSITSELRTGAGSDTLDIFGVNAGGAALQAGLLVIDGGDDASSADGQIDTLNLRGVVEVLTDLQNWEAINLLNNSRAHLGPVSRRILTEQFFIQSGSVLIADSAAGGQTFTIGGSLRNEGIIDMQGAGVRYDTVAVPVTYTGGAGALVKMDTFLGERGSPSDLLKVGASTAGATGLVINNTNAGPGVFNPQGIEVVRVESVASGFTKADHFALVGGPIRKDLWVWDLGLDATRSNPGRSNADVHVLYSRPGGEVQFTPYFATGALTAFHTSLEPWIDRQLTLSNTIAVDRPVSVARKGDVPATRYIDLWAAPFGARRLQDSTSQLTFFEDTFSARTDYSQSTYGFQAGVDFISKWGGNTALMAGVFGGWLDSTISPHAISLRGRYEGGTVGAYASYMQGGLMLSAVLNANLLDFDWRASALDLKANSGVDTLGGRIEATYKLYPSVGGAAWLQPYANLAYARSSWDQFSVLATTFAIQDNESLLGRLGLRVGADVRTGQSLLNVFAGAGVVYEFNDTNKADIVSGGFTLPLAHNFDATSLELQGGVKWTDVGKGLSLSITSTGRFSEDVQEYGGKATVNFQF